MGGRNYGIKRTNLIKRPATSLNHFFTFTRISLDIQAAARIAADRKRISPRETIK